MAIACLVGPRNINKGCGWIVGAVKITSASGHECLFRTWRVDFSARRVRVAVHLKITVTVGLVGAQWINVGTEHGVLIWGREAVLLLRAR